jgi:2'-5' RNA ligase
MTDASITRFVVDDMWGAECSGYHLQFRPEADVIERIVSLQDHIVSHFDHLRRVPPEALHMTVLILLPATREKAALDHIWTRVGSRCIEAGSRLCASLDAIPVEWSTVRAYDKAIVLAGGAHAHLQKLRADVVDAVSEPAFRPSPPQLAHVTLFRYADLDPRLAGFEQQCEPITTPIHEIRLVREDRYPSLELEVLERWRLGSAVTAYHAATDLSSRP